MFNKKQIKLPCKSTMAMGLRMASSSYEQGTSGAQRVCSSWIAVARKRVQSWESWEQRRE